MESDAAVSYLVLAFGAIFILFGLKNLIANPFLGASSLAAMAVLFGGLLSGAAILLGKHPRSPDSLE
ncbi:MAG: hypothetical protein JRM80_10775 [Nitrososphaerota archaeon]|nr:hypothetical protein [Nitrososphaerota archaeon]